MAYGPFFRLDSRYGRLAQTHRTLKKNGHKNPIGHNDSPLLLTLIKVIRQELYGNVFAYVSAII